MGKRIQGITVEIGGNTTKLQDALKKVTGSINSTQKALRDVNRLLKLDPKNVELLAQKQRLLKEATEQTRQKLQTLKEADKQLKQQLDSGKIGQEKYDAFQREIAETEQSLKSLEKQAKDLQDTLDRKPTFGEKMADMGGKLQTAGEKMQDAGRKATVVSAAVAAAGTAAVKTAADFESSMSQVQATMGITKDAMSDVNGQSVNTMDALSDLAKKMGAETAFSASQCADALNYLALAGYDTQQMMDTLPIVLNLAAAGNIDLAQASDMVTDAMSALGMESSGATKMVDQMAKTASTTNTSVAQLGEGILTIGATAKSVKGGTAELNTALGILANNGIKGAEGGTHLRNVILSLQTPTDAAASALTTLGVSVYDSEGNMRSLNDVLGDLNTSMDGMTSEEKANIINQIFNKTDLASVNALLSNTGDTWSDLQAKIENSGGAAQKMAETQLDNLSGQLTILKSSIEGFAIAIGEALMPAIKKIASKIQDFVNWLNSLDEGARQTIVQIGLLVAAFGPALLIVGKITSTVGALMTVFAGISAPVLAVVAVIGVLVAAFTTLWATNEEFRQKITEIWSGIVDTISGFCQGIVDRINAMGFNFTSILDVLKAAWDVFCQFLAPVFEGVFAYIASVLESVTEIILGILDVFIGIFTGNWAQAWNGVKEIFGGIWDGIKGQFSAILDTVIGLLDAFLGLFGSSWDEAWTSIKTFCEEVWTGITGFISGALTGISNVFTTIFNAIKTAVTTIFNAIKNVISSVVNGISSTVSGVFNSMSNTISGIFNGIRSLASSAWNGVKNAIISPIQEAVNRVGDMVSRIKGFFSNLHLRLPHIALPHIRLSGTFSIMPPRVPSIGIDWYAKGGIMTKPTIFGMNGSSLMAGGEAGHEAILPLDGFYKQLSAMIDSKLDMGRMERYLSVIADNSSKGIYLQDGTLVGHLLPNIDAGLGKAGKIQERLRI